MAETFCRCTIYMTMGRNETRLSQKGKHKVVNIGDIRRVPTTKQK